MTVPAPPLASTIPAAIDALLALASRVVPKGTRVSDGYVRFTGTDEDVFSVGGGVDSTVDGEERWAATGARREEEYAIRCYAFSQHGGKGQKLARDRAYAIRDAVAAGVRADSTLAGVVRVAQVTGPTVLRQTAPTLPETAKAGVFAEVEFLVSCRARI